MWGWLPVNTQSRLSRWLRLSPALLALLIAFQALAQTSAVDAQSAAALWRDLTALDVRAAYSLLMENHPAAAPEANDPGFVAALEAARARALTRAAQVSSHEGYAATLGEFATSLGDDHIASAPTHVPRTVRWAGVVAGLQGSHWIVAADDPKLTGAELKGARIIECGGRAAEEFARDVLHYVTGVGVQGQMSINAPWLLIDQGNPFVTPPRECTFDQGGKQTVLTLAWQPVSRTELLQHHWHYPYGSAGFSVRASGGGYWVALEELEADAQPVIDEVTRQAAQIQAAAYVVVDVRGNGGGSDHYMRVLADLIYGQAHTDAILGRYDGEGEQEGACPQVFRASVDNIKYLSAAADDLRRQGNTAVADLVTRAVQQMRAAAAAGKALTGPAACPARKPLAKKAPPSLARGKVFILTDAGCFSSCISGVGFFRQLGATQIGQVTRAATHYAEAREIVLPSGLSSFATLQGLQRADPVNIGPYSPAIEYEGDMADTAALERWVSELAQAPPGAAAAGAAGRP